MKWLALFLVPLLFTMLALACEEEEEESATVTASPAVAVTATLEATPTPTSEPATRQVRQPIWTISQLSSAGQGQIVLEDGQNEYTVASLDPEMARFQRWEIAFVADVNADGLVDAIVNHYTGGAHCCFEYLFFSATPSAIQLDDAFLLGNGNAIIRAVKDLDGDGVLELESSDDRLAYFPDLSFAESPFLPLVLCRSAQGVYVDCTPQFPELLESSALEFEGQLGDAVQRQAREEEKRGAALGLFATYVRLGTEEAGWSRVRSLCPECEGWLMENLDDLEQRLSSVQPSRPAPMQ
jgi:hypothetical protein